jgi:hypothetical protein
MTVINVFSINLLNIMALILLMHTKVSRENMNLIYNITRQMTGVLFFF